MGEGVRVNPVEFSPLAFLLYLFTGWTVHSVYFGYPVYYDPLWQVWRYEDTKQRISVKRPCPHCGEYQTVEGYDPCIGYVPGAVSVCCGHGREPLHIVYEGD